MLTSGFTSTLRGSCEWISIARDDLSLTNPILTYLFPGDAPDAYTLL